MKFKTFFFCFFASFLTVLSSFAFSKAAPTIHIFGDSHSREFEFVPHCTVHWLGPVTMHRMGRDGLSFLNLKQSGVEENQIAIFAFGEIDVRCHVGKQRDQFNRELGEVIETLAVMYIYRILENKAQYKNLTCVVYSVTPPTDSGFNPYYPYYGSLEERIMISKLLNRRLAELSDQVGIYFLDVYDDYATPEGSLIPEYSDGTVHINHRTNQFIIKKLKVLLQKLNIQDS